MTKIIALVALLGLSGCLAGLSYMGKPVAGAASVYAETATNEAVTENPNGPKVGEACSVSYLGVVTLGDASVAEASKKAGISRVYSVDNKFKNILGVYAQYCVVVSGN